MAISFCSGPCRPSVKNAHESLLGDEKTRYGGVKLKAMEA